MKRGKKLGILLLTLVVLAAASFGASKLTVATEQPEEVQTTTVFTLAPEDVTSLCWEYSEELAFDKEEDGWTYRENSVFPMEESYLNAILDTLTDVESYKTIDTVENWDTYGLEIPVCTISVTTDATYELAIGIETSLGGQRYFSIGDGKVYLVDSAVLEPFQYGLYDLLAEQEMPQVEDLTAITLERPSGTETYTYLPGSGRTYSDDYVWFLEDKTLDTQLTERFLVNITALPLTDCANYDAQDLSVYGLDTPEITATVYDGADVAYTLKISPEVGGKRYTLLPGTNMVYEVGDNVLQALLYTTYADLMPDEVLLMDWDTVTKVSVSLAGKTYDLLPGSKEVTDDEGNTTQEKIWTVDGEEVEFAQVLDSLTDMDSSGYATGLTPEGESQIAFRIYRDREAFSEVELAFYIYNSSDCIVTLDGTTTVTVDREDLETLVQTVTGLLVS